MSLFYAHIYDIMLTYYIHSINILHILPLSTGLYLSIKNKELILSNSKQKWTIHNNYLEHTKTKMYIACDIYYNIYLTNDKCDAIHLTIENNMICYIKPEFRVKFEINNAKLMSFDLAWLNKKIFKKEKTNVGILLAGGFSTRFKNEKYKQLYEINKKPIFIHSLESMINILDKIVIITNNKCYDDITTLVKKYKNVKVLKNNIDCRLESIYTGLKYFNKQKKY